jgi:hypothetical protein
VRHAAGHLRPARRGDLVSRDFWRTLERVEVEKIKLPGAPREPSVRMYCSASPRTFGDEARWTLQLRGPTRLASGRQGRDYAMATSSLSLADLVALRDELDAVIRDALQERGRDPGNLPEMATGVRPHAFAPSRYADTCGSCGSREGDGVHKLSQDEISPRTKTLNLRRPRRKT